MIKDVAELFAAEGEGALKVLETLKEEAKDALSLSISQSPPKGDTLGMYRYFKAEQLPLLLRLEDPGERRAALSDIAKAQNLGGRNLQASLSAAEKEAQKSGAGRPADEVTPQENLAPEPGTERHERAMELLECPDVLQKVAEDMERLGHVGELDAKKLAFVCSVSARAGSPIQPSTHAQSSAGKNFLWDTVLSLLPQEKVIKRSGFSAKALFRTQADLKGAVLYIQEMAGSEDADFSIRVLQSDGRLEYESTEKLPDGTIGTVVYQKEGPCVVVQTTTRNHLHPENETRVFPIYIDESDRQTGLILKSIMTEAAGGGTNHEDKEAIRQAWQDAIRLLEEHGVVVPYAERIELPHTQVRMRRDARRLLDVIRVIAWLRQYRRERDLLGCIVATEEDFHTALGLVEGSLTRAWKVMTPAEERVMEAIKALPYLKRAEGFRKRDLDVPGVSDRRLNEILKSLADTGYLDADGRKGPQGYEYTLARDEEKTSLGISLRPPPEDAESAGKGHNSDEREGSASQRQAPEATANERDMQAVGATGRGPTRHIETLDLQQEPVNGRSEADSPRVNSEPENRWVTDAETRTRLDHDAEGEAVSPVPVADDQDRPAWYDEDPGEGSALDPERVRALKASLREFLRHAPRCWSWDAADIAENITFAFYYPADFAPTAAEVEATMELILEDDLPQSPDEQVQDS